MLIMQEKLSKHFAIKAHLLDKGHCTCNYWINYPKPASWSCCLGDLRVGVGGGIISPCFSVDRLDGNMLFCLQKSQLPSQLRIHPISGAPTEVPAARPGGRTSAASLPPYPTVGAQPPARSDPPRQQAPISLGTILTWKTLKTFLGIPEMS